MSYPLRRFCSLARPLIPSGKSDLTQQYLPVSLGQSSALASPTRARRWVYHGSRPGGTRASPQSLVHQRFDHRYETSFPSLFERCNRRQAREQVGARSADIARNEGLIPAVIYGGEGNHHITVDAIEAEKAMNLIVLEAKKALNEFSKKSSKDHLSSQLEKFLSSLSDEELNQFKITKDFSELVKAIKTMEINDLASNNFKDIKNIEDHIIESMIKRFFDNA